KRSWPDATSAAQGRWHLRRDEGLKAFAAGRASTARLHGAAGGGDVEPQAQDLAVGAADGATAEELAIVHGAHLFDGLVDVAGVARGAAAQAGHDGGGVSEVF